MNSSSTLSQLLYRLRQFFLPLFLWFSDLIQALSIGLRISILSVLVLVVIFLLIWMDQGYTLIIDLLDHRAPNLLYFWIILWGLREIVSHYPTYLDKWRIHRNQVFDLYNRKINYDGFPTWLRDPLHWSRMRGLGFITYDKVELDDERRAEFDYYEQTVHYKVDVLRRFFGLLLFGVVIYAICRCWIRQIDPTREPQLASLRNLLVIVIPLTYFGVRFFARRARQSALIRRGGRRLCILFFYLVIALKIAALVVSARYGWSAQTVATVVFTLWVELISFSLFKNFRTYFQTLGLGEAPLWGQPPFFANYTRYLAMLGLTGVLAWGIIITSHIQLYAFSPIVVILSYLHVIYGLVIILAKHYFYYLDQRRKRFWLRRSLIPTLPLLLLVLALFASSRGNDLHLLPLQSQDPEKVLSLDDFTNEMRRHFNDSTAAPARDTLYFIASYGGGLKANIWNMLVLNELSRRKGRNILEHTVAMSGVSGGALGLAFFSALYAQHPDGGTCEPPRSGSSTCYEHRRAIIRRMGRTNMLSMDATYALGWDLLREFRLRSGPIGPDRAKIAMREYGKLLEENETETRLDRETYQNVWYELFDAQRQRGSFYPLLLMNSAGTHIQRGVSATVDMGTRFDSIFHDAIDLAGHDPQRQRGLSYLHTASTTNRFPIASPTAKIEGKGHFLDGGYFENSGMLSLLDLYTYLRREQPDLFAGKTVQFIQIGNDKYNVIHDLFGRQLNEAVEISESTEVSAILGTVTTISMLPNYLQRFMETQSDVRFANIHLPYLLLERDLLAFRKSQALGQLDTAMLERYNDCLRRALSPSPTYERIAPPLARLLGRQAVRYMELVIEDGMVFGELEGRDICASYSGKY